MVQVYVLPRDFTQEELDALSNYSDWINRYHFPKFDTHYNNVTNYWDTYFTQKPVKFLDGSCYAYYVLEKDVEDIDEVQSVVKTSMEYTDRTELPDPRINLE